MQEAIRLEPHNARAHFNLGVALSQTGNYDQAVEYYREAIRLDPKHVAANFDMANVLYKKGHAYDAIRLYERTLKLDPHHRWANFNLGELSTSSGPGHQHGRTVSANITPPDGSDRTPLRRALNASRSLRGA